MVSEMLRVVKGKIGDTKSLLLIISQTRDNLGFGAIFTPKVRSGGKALKFYCSHEIWLAVGKKKKKSDLEIGADVMGKVSKNKLTGKKREVTFPIYYDYGIDDCSSCLDFILELGHWKKGKIDKKTNEFTKDAKGQIIDAQELGIQAAYKKLIEDIEDNNLEDDLFAIAQTVWKEREDSIKLNRKKKFT